MSRVSTTSSPDAIRPATCSIAAETKSEEELQPGSTCETEKVVSAGGEGGVRATIDMNLQRATEESVEYNLRQHGKEYGVTERLHCIGHVSYDDIPKYAACSDILAYVPPVADSFLSRETSPMKLFEYMAAGIPVVASDFPLWRKIVEDAKAGMVVDPLNPQAIAAAVEQLISDTALAEEMGRNGRKAVEEQYNWNHEEKELLKIYQSLL